MLDVVLYEKEATVDQIRATVQELDTRLAEAYEAVRERLGHALYRLGYRLQGEAYEPYEREEWK